MRRYGGSISSQVSEGTHRTVLKRLLDIATRIDWFRSAHATKIARRQMDALTAQRVLSKLGTAKGSYTHN